MSKIKTIIITAAVMTLCKVTGQADSVFIFFIFLLRARGFPQLLLKADVGVRFVLLCDVRQLTLGRGRRSSREGRVSSFLATRKTR